MKMNVRRRFMSVAPRFWALTALVSLSTALIPLAAPPLLAQLPPVGAPPADTTRAAINSSIAGTTADPLRGNPSVMTSLGSQARTMQDGF